MDLFSAMKVSASGLSLQRTRMNVVSSNLANASTTRTPEGGPYQRKEVIVEARPLFEQQFGSALADAVRTAEVAQVRSDASAPRMVFDPSHPDADENGYVAMPNVNIVEEMVDMMNASRGYEANATAVQTAKTMAQRAIEIGKR
jgi:flagellar basal-body rod protein FlgC